MNLRNCMEDVVSDVLEILLKERNQDKHMGSQTKTDIIAFSLNRLPPRYIVSERGFTHSHIEEIQNNKWKTDIISVVNKGIDAILKRERSHHKDNTTSIKDENTTGITLYQVKSDVQYFNFPHFIGRVYDEETLKPLDEVKVSLYMDDKLVDSSDKSWANPYTTHHVTKGFYSFWPKVYEIEGVEPEERVFNFLIKFERKGYCPQEKEFYVGITSEEVKYRFIRRNFTEKIDIITMEKIND